MTRPKSPGRVYYLGRVRYIPGLYSKSLGQWLERFTAAGQHKKLLMLEDLIAGNSGTLGELISDLGEDPETAEILEGLLLDL